MWLFAAMVPLLLRTSSAHTGPLLGLLTTTVSGDCTILRYILNYPPPDLSILKVYVYNDFGSETLPLSADALIASPKFDVSKPVVLFVHGFIATMTSRGTLAIAKAFVDKGGRNVISLDTGNLIVDNYERAHGYVEAIGNAVGVFLADLSAKGSIAASDMYLVGHSLGAHISGYAGKYLLRQSKTLKRITALDPAGPCFFRVPPSQRLEKGDASFVDVIHSDAGGFGIDISIGHMDFFPNGGSDQPNCYVPMSSHIRSWELFVESIYNEGNFPSKSCSSYLEFKMNFCNGPSANMGYGVVPSTGNYYLKTEGSPPFGLGDPFYKRTLFDQILSRFFNG